VKKFILLWLLLFSTTAYGSPIIWLKMDGNANDSSGNNLHGTVNGATLATDRFGNPNSAYSFDGVDDYIDMPKQSPAHFTISEWIKPNVSDHTAAVLLYSYSGSGIELHLSNDSQSFLFTLDRGAEDSQLRAYTPIQYNTWTHIAASYDGTWMRIYLNGNLIGSLEETRGYTDSSISTMRIGTRSDQGPHVSGHYLDGVIDDFMFFNYALSIEEIRAYADSQIPFEENSPILFEENFEAYANGSTLSGQGGWISDSDTIIGDGLVVSI